MERAQAKVSESRTSMVLSVRSGNKGSRGESSGYVLRSKTELDSEAPGVLVVMDSDLFIVSSQILRRVERSGSILFSFAIMIVLGRRVVRQNGVDVFAYYCVVVCLMCCVV